MQRKFRHSEKLSRWWSRLLADLSQWSFDKSSQLTRLLCMVTLVWRLRDLRLYPETEEATRRSPEDAFLTEHRHGSEVFGTTLPVAQVEAMSQ